MYRWNLISWKKKGDSFPVLRWASGKFLDGGHQKFDQCDKLIWLALKGISFILFNKYKDAVWFEWLHFQIMFPTSLRNTLHGYSCWKDPSKDLNLKEWINLWLQVLQGKCSIHRYVKGQDSGRNMSKVQWS